MPHVDWPAASDHRYWMDLKLGNRDARVMIDLGLVDPLDRVGLEVEPILFNELKQAGQLARMRRRARRDASGRITWTDSGEVTAQMVDPTTRIAIGPAVDVYVWRGEPGVPDRVGMSFFHRLATCRVIWDLGGCIWRVEYP